MTLLELQKMLGETIQGVKDGTADVDKAEAIASLAKRMINNADIVLHTDKHRNIPVFAAREALEATYAISMFVEAGYINKE